MKVINTAAHTMNLTLMCANASTFRAELLSLSCKKSWRKFQKLISGYKVDQSVCTDVETWRYQVNCSAEQGQTYPSSKSKKKRDQHPERYKNVGRKISGIELQQITCNARGSLNPPTPILRISRRVFKI